MAEPNPRNCRSCHHRSSTGDVFCMAPLPKFIVIGEGRKVKNPDDACDVYKPVKGHFVRICLNCGDPIRTHHKYAIVGEKQWVHKCCEHPNSPSKWHHEKYGN